MTEQADSKQTNTDNDTLMLQRIRQELDRSCGALDGATQSRLNAMRHAALAHGQRKRRKSLALPFGGLVSACVLVLAVLLQGPMLSGPVSQQQDTPIEDLDLLTASEELDFYEEYEFYQWLATSDAGY